MNPRILLVEDEPAVVLVVSHLLGLRRKGEGPGPGESEWMFLELDPVYARQTWLPELTRIYLNPGKEVLSEVAVKTRASPPETIFSTRNGEAPAGIDPVVIGFNSKPAGGRLQGGLGNGAYRTLSVWPRSGGLAAAVTDARANDYSSAESATQKDPNAQGQNH